MPGVGSDRPASQWDQRIEPQRMALKLTVPTLNSPETAQQLKETLLTSEPNAKVEVDTQSKTVTVESQASEETFKQLIIAAGHQISTGA